MRDFENNLFSTQFSIWTHLFLGLQRFQRETFGFIFTFITWYFKKPWNINKNIVFVNSGSLLGVGVSLTIPSCHIMWSHLNVLNIFLKCTVLLNEYLAYMRFTYVKFKLCVHKTVGQTIHLHYENFSYMCVY